MGSPQFDSPSEFREVMDRTFALMSEDEAMGPKLRDADVPQRFEFTDLDLVVNVAVAIARRRIKTGGDVKAALALIPITKPIYAMYRSMVEADYPHLKA